MEFELLYWHWIVFGIVLMLSEIFLGSFFILWFGAAATIVGLMLVPFPGISEVAQIIFGPSHPHYLLSAGSSFSNLWPRTKPKPDCPRKPY